jgi:hypothetical protein
MEAETATKKVIGVKAVAEDMKVKFPTTWNKSNVDIAKEVVAALKSNWSLPADKVTVKVEDGWVTLEGELPWNYQREAAKNAVHYLSGVKGVTNQIKIKSETQDAIEKKDMENLPISRAKPLWKKTVAMPNSRFSFLGLLPVNNRMMRSIEEGASAGHAQEVQKQFESTIPLGRYAESIEIAKLVLFLASNESEYITGTTQVIDGGMCAQ